MSSNPLPDALRALLDRYAEAIRDSEIDGADEARAALEASLGEYVRDAQAWRAFQSVRNVDGAGWSVRHPREDGDSFYVGFGWPMTPDVVLDAVKGGGLGWAPDLATMLRNAAAAIDAARASHPEPGAPV